MIFEAAAVSKSFRSGPSRQTKLAVDNASLEVAPGQFVAVVGESGSGKSTLARIMLGLIPPTSGVVRLGGEDIAEIPRMRFRKLVQAVLQDPAGSLNPRKPVWRSLAEVVRLHRIADSRAETQRIVSETLELVGLTPPERFFDRAPHELSGGQRQRVLIARAMLVSPQLIVADEAVSALDASVKSGVLGLLRDIQRERGVGYLFITHDLPVVRKVADTVHVMRAGRIVESGPTDQLFIAPTESYTRELLAAAPTLLGATAVQDPDGPPATSPTNHP